MSDNGLKVLSAGNLLLCKNVTGVIYQPRVVTCLSGFLTEISPLRGEDELALLMGAPGKRTGGLFPSHLPLPLVINFLGIV